jgi:type IV secretory pathway VirB10-like protein
MELTEKANKNALGAPSTMEITEAPAPPDEEVSAAEASTTSFREIFRNALNRARREHKPVTSRKELSRDKSKSMFLLAAVAVALLLVFLGVFSAPKKPSLPSERRNGPNLGRKVTPGQEETGQGKSATPLLDASLQPGETAPGNPVTAEDVGRTSRSGDGSMLHAAVAAPEKPSPGKPKDTQQYALKGIDFSDAVVAQQAAAAPLPPQPPSESSDLKKPSIVFVRSTQSTALPTSSQSAILEQSTVMSSLPAGTRLVARLEAPVSSAVAAPVVAVVEYNYEREGEIVLPAGAKVFGKLVQANPSGYVGLQFDRMEMPDGTMGKIDATAMDLKYGPLKGDVSGKRRGAKFLVNSLTGVGTVAAYMVGGHGTTGFDGPISENALLRERIADNVANAGQGELNQLSFNQNIVVTIPGNTRFYLVLQKGGADLGAGTNVHSTGTAAAAVGSGNVPSLEELRELMQLRRELNQMYQQTSVQTTTPAPQ